MNLDILQQLHEADSYGQQLTNILLTNGIATDISLQDLIEDVYKHCKKNKETDNIVHHLKSLFAKQLNGPTPVKIASEESMQAERWQWFIQEIRQHQKETEQSQVGVKGKLPFPQVFYEKDLGQFQLPVEQGANLQKLTSPSHPASLADKVKQQSQNSELPSYVSSPSERQSQGQLTLQEHRQLHNPTEKQQQQYNPKLEEKEHEKGAQAFIDPHVLKRAICKLLAINVTDLFQQELKEVKDDLTQQINDSESYLISSITAFLGSYQELRNMKDYMPSTTSEEKQLLQPWIKYYKQEYLNEQSNKVRFCQSTQHCFKSQLYRYWQKMQEGMRKNIQAKKEPLAYQTIRQKLDDSLKNITLYYTPGISVQQIDKHFGESNANSTFINVNHIVKNINVEQFKKTVLRPLLFLVIVHQITHRLIRNIDQYNIVGNDESIEIKEQYSQNGPPAWKQIINLAIYNRSAIREILELAEIKYFQERDNGSLKKKILKSIDRWDKFIVGCGQYTLRLREKFDEFNMIRKTFILMPIISKQAISLNNSDFNKHLEELMTFIFKYQAHKQPSFPKEKTYSGFTFSGKFALAVFLYAGQYKFSIFKSQKDQYMRASKRIINSSFVDRFILTQDTFGDSLWPQLEQFHQKLQQQQLVEAFQQYFLCLNPITNLQNKLSRISTQFCSSKEQLEQIEIIFNDIQPAKEISQFQKGIYLLLSSYFNKQILHKADCVLRLHTAYSRAMSLMKFSQLLLVCADLPCYYLCKKLNDDTSFDSGYYIQDCLFPKVKQNKFIFGKDYAYMKNLNVMNALQIGVLPKSQKIQKKPIAYVRVKRQSVQTNNTEIGATVPFECGWQRHKRRKSTQKKRKH